jgi:hypothetical protein
VSSCTFLVEKRRSEACSWAVRRRLRSAPRGWRRRRPRLQPHPTVTQRLNLKAYEGRCPDASERRHLCMCLCTGFQVRGWRLAGARCSAANRGDQGLPWCIIMCAGAEETNCSNFTARDVCSRTLWPDLGAQQTLVPWGFAGAAHLEAANWHKVHLQPGRQVRQHPCHSL